MMGLDPLRDMQRVGIDQYRAGLGEYLGAVASDAWANAPMSQIGRLIDLVDAQRGAEERGETMLSAKDASDEGRDLGLRFDQPIARGAFNVLADEKRRQAAAEATFRRARLEDSYGTLHWLLAGGTEFLVQAADPLNVASAFIPVIGEARAAVMAARIGGFGAALAKGAAEGAVGQALLEPLNYVDRRAQGGDYGMLDTLTSLAFGAGLGVALHGAAYGAGAGFRFIRDRYKQRRAPETGSGADAVPPPAPDPLAPMHEQGARDYAAWLARGQEYGRSDEPPPRQPVAEAMERLRPETKDAALHVAVVQLAQDKPVDVEPVLGADPSWRVLRAEVRAAVAEQVDLQARSVASVPLPSDTGPPPDWQPSAEELRVARRVARGWAPDVRLRRPTSLVDFVRAAGGLLKDTPEAGDLLSQDIGRQPGLLRTRDGGGRGYDDMAQAAKDAGYDIGPDLAIGNGINADRFMRMLVEDASGTRKHFPREPETEAWEAQQRYFAEFKRDLDNRGIRAKGMAPRELAWLLRHDPDAERLMDLVNRIDRLGPDASLELAARLEAERVRLEGEMLAADLEPGALEHDAAFDHRNFPAATLDELERFYADVERTAGPRDAWPEAAGGRPAAGRADAGGETRAPGRGGRDPAAEGAGLRREGEPRAEGTEGAAAGLGPTDPGTWSNRDHDLSVEVYREPPQPGADGRSYQRVRYDGRDSFVPADELRTVDEWTPTPEELAHWAERQQLADLHADPDALAARDERLTGEARDAAQRLQEDLKAYGHLLDDESRVVFDEAGKVFDDDANGIKALAACQLGGA